MTCCQSPVRPIFGRPFFSSARIRIPIIEPTMLPEPPVMDVPPMIAPPMASSSSPRPDEAVIEEALLAAKAMPAMPANRPEMM